ncbi:spermatogenesis-associated protein 31E1 [Perognathus longimembris pacificus]|uniref:spermatogenesis-associated protein 31E1 n=1 Tax=Perognathus longimembris pacificus TaxID=214514 RepID=UPI0020189580|nr:spermatogenesis-associated protein 31E1 [Perognathus longimembris pacificus]
MSLCLHLVYSRYWGYLGIKEDFRFAWDMAESSGCSGSKERVNIRVCHLGKLNDTSSFQHILKGDALGEVFNTESVTAHLSPRQSEKDTSSSTVSPEASPAPSPEGLKPLASTLSPVQICSSVSIESHSSQSVSQPPEPLIALEHSPPCSHSPQPVVCPPSRPNSNLGLPLHNIMEVSPETIPESSPTSTSRLPSPIPALNSDILEVLEIVISKRAKLKASQCIEHPLESLGNMMKSLGSEQDRAIPQVFWNTKEKPQQLPDPQELFFPMVLKKYIQLFWGLPFLHSESLVAPVKRSSHPLHLPSILFNSSANFMPGQVQAKVPPQHFPPQPLLNHLVKSQHFTPTLPWPQPPPVAEVQAHVHVPSCTPILSSHSPPMRSYTVPPVVQQLEHHLAKKHLESKRLLPSMVKQSQKAIIQGQGPLHQRGFINVPGDFFSFETRKRLERHLQERILQHPCRANCNTQLSPDGKFPGTHQAKDDHASLQNSVCVYNTCLNTQKATCSVAQGWENSRRGMEHFMSSIVEDMDTAVESSSVDFLDAKTEREFKSSFNGPSNSDPEYSPPVHFNMNHRGETLKAHLITKWEQINEDKFPLQASHSRESADRAMTPLKNSNSSMQTGSDSPSETRATCKSSSQELSHSDAATRQLLDAHIKKLWVKHKWGLSLKILKTINYLTLKKVPPVPISQGASPNLACSNLKANPTVKGGIFQGEALYKIPKTVERKKTEGHIIQPSKPPSVHKTLRGTYCSYICGPSEAPPTGEAGRLRSESRSYSLIGRTWHHDIVPGSDGSSPEPTTSPVMGMFETQEKENLYHNVSIREVFVESERTEDLRDMAEDKEEQPTNFTVNMDSNNLNLRNLDILRTNQISFPSRFSISKHPRDSCLKKQAESSSTSESPPFNVILQDCEADTFLQDCAPEVLLAANLLASQSSLTSSQNCSGSSTSTSYETSSPSSRGEHIMKQQEPQTSNLQFPWYSKMFHGPREKSCERPNATTQKEKPARTRPSQGWKVNSPAQVRKTRTGRKNSALPAPERGQHPPESHFGNRIKSFFMSVFSTKGKSQADSLQNSKIHSTNTKNQVLSTSRIFKDNEVPEAQTFMSTAERIVEEKMVFQHAPSASKKTLHKEGINSTDKDRQYDTDIFAYT